MVFDSRCRYGMMKEKKRCLAVRAVTLSHLRWCGVHGSNVVILTNTPKPMDDRTKEAILKRGINP